MESIDKPSDVVSTTDEENVVVQSPSKTGHSEDSIPVENPLLNRVVVTNIVELLNPTFEQLKTLRLISKIWSETTHHRWRNSTAALTLISDPTLFAPPDLSEGLPVSQFLTEFQDPQSPFQLASKPFSTYKFKGHTFDILVCNKENGPAKAFWETIGPLIESLHFESSVFQSPLSSNEVTCPMTQLLVEFMPNVKELSLNEVVIQGPVRPIDLQDDAQVFISKPQVNLQTLTVIGNVEGNMDLKDLLKMAPNLESIKGTDLANVIEMNEQTLMEPICQVRFITKPEKPAPLSNLKHLDLLNSSKSSSFLNNEYNEYSWYSGIPLKKNKAGNVTQLPLESLALQLEADPSNLGDEDVSWNLDRYLTSFSSTLKTLKAYRFPVGPPYSTFLSGSFGDMTSLKEIHLWGTIAPHLGFLKSTPNLKLLRIDLGCFEKRVHLMNWIRNHDNVTVKYHKYQSDMALEVAGDMKEAILCPELESLDIDFEFPEESLRLLGKWMPNLKILKSILNGRTVPVVCEVWRDLTELVCLHGSRIEDECIIRDDEEAGRYSEGSPAKLKICDLNDLKRFQSDTYCCESQLTNAAVFKGFLKMSGLKSIQICVGEDMGDEAVEALRKGIQFCDVIRNGEMIDDVQSDDDSCGCDRCAFRREAEEGFRGSDYGSLIGSEEAEDQVEMLRLRRQWEDSDEDGSFADGGSGSGESDN